MNFNEEIYWQIQDYLKGKLEGNALLEFEDRLNKDTNLLQEIELQKLADKLIVENRIQSASQVSLNAIKSIKKNNFRKKTITAGSIAVILVSLLSYYITQKENTLSSNTIITSEKKLISENPDEVILHSTKDPLTSPEIPNIKAEKRVQIEISDTSPMLTDSSESLLQTQPEFPKAEKGKQENFVNTQTNNINTNYHDCSDTKIKGHVSVKNSCQNEANGHIYASDFEGGNSPYSYKVYSIKDKGFIPSNNLTVGIYNVVISDNSNCSITYSNISVKGISCQEVEKSFNPFIGEIFELGEKDQEGILIIYSKSGDIHYSKDFSKSENLQWNGVTNNGATETGYYIYTIKYKDGTSVQGEVTVTR